MSATEQIRLPVESLRPWTLLRGKVRDPDGNILFNRRTILTPKLLDGLRGQGYSYLLYQRSPPITPGRVDERHPYGDITTARYREVEENILDSLRNGDWDGQIPSGLRRLFILDLKRIVKAYINRQFTDFSSCLNNIARVIRRIKFNPSALAYLIALRTHDYYSFIHSINVGLISIMVATRLELEEEEIVLVGVGGFLHDVGKIQVPAWLLNKTGVLSNEEKQTLKDHPTFSLQILRDDPLIHPRVISMAYEHHERFDGGGYPRGIQADSLDDYSSIVAIADVFDALTSVRAYKLAFSPGEAIEVIETYTGTHFSPEVAEKFIRNLRHYLAEHNEFKAEDLVVLSDRRVARILGKRRLGPEERFSAANLEKAGGGLPPEEAFAVRVLTDKRGHIQREQPELEIGPGTPDLKIVRHVNPEENRADMFKLSEIKSSSL